MASKVIVKIKEYTLPIILTIAVALLGYYYSNKWSNSPAYIERPEHFKEVLQWGLAILSSGIFLATLKWFQLMGFFKEEIQKIISSSEFEKTLQKTVYDTLYSDEFLKKRADLKDVWKRVNRNLFKSEFPEELVEKIESEISETFLYNSNLSHYFKQYIITVNVNLTADDFLEIEEICEMKLVRQNKEKFDFDFKYYVIKESKDDTNSYVKFEKICANKKAFDLSKTEIKKDEEFYISKINLELQDEKEYNIESNIRLKYNINKDFEYQCYSERFVDYMRAEVNFSKNLRVIFLPLGNEEFDTVKESDGKIVKVFKEVLLPKKGFRLIFVKRS